jgi:ABC-type lipoprotein release transport system permease subunit
VYRFILAFRYLRARKITYFSVAGVALGVMALIVVLSVMEGFQRDFKGRIRGMLSDLSIRYRGAEPVEEALRKIEAVPHVAGASPRLRGMAILGGRGRSGIETIGIDPEREGKVSDLPKYVMEAEVQRASSLAALYIEDSLFQVQDLIPRFEKILKEGDASFAPGERENFQNRVERSRAFARTLEELLKTVREEGGFPAVRKAYLGYLQALRDFGLLDEKGVQRIEKEVRARLDALEQDRLAAETARERLRGNDFPLPFSSSGAREVIVGEELASRQLRVLIGETVQMVTGSAQALPTAREGAAQGDWKVVGTFKSGMYKTDSGAVFLPLGAAQSFSGREGLVSEIAIRLDDYAHAEEVKERLKELFPGQEVRTWEEQRRTYLEAIRLEKSVLAVSLFMIVVVAGFPMLATFLMMVAEKTRDLGILKALGGGTGGIASIFLLTCTFIGVLGSGIGTAAGVLIALNLNPIEAFARSLGVPTPFPRDLYYLNQIPVVIQPWEIVWIVAPTILLSVLLGGVLPAVRAARLDPLEALRYE